MKKIFIFIAAGVLMLTSCTSSVAKRAAEEAKLSIAEGDYMSALNYVELAVKEGYNDKEFLKLVKLVENYRDARSALDEMDPDKAEQIINAADSFEGSGMTFMIDELKKDIVKLREDSAEYEEDIEEIEHDIEKERYYVASDEAEELLKEELTKSQRERVENLKNSAEEKKQQKRDSKPTATAKPASNQLSPKAILTKEEAVEIARKELSAAADAEVTVELKEDYYQISFKSVYEFDGETIYDEVACKVDARTGMVYDQAG